MLTCASCGRENTGDARFCQFVYLRDYLGRLGRSLCMLGRFDEAEEAAERARSLEEELGTPVREYTWRQVLARVLAHGGDPAEAERLAREAVAVSEASDLLNEQCLVLWDLGEVLAVAGHPDDAAAAFEQALDRCERKNLALARQVRERLADLRAEAPSA